MRRAIVIAGILVNLVVPGLGTLMMGRLTTGVIQLGLIAAIWLIGFVTFGFGAFVLAPVHLAVVAWALVGGIWHLVRLPNHRELRAK